MTKKLSSLPIYFTFFTDHEVEIRETYDDIYVIDKKATGNSIIFWGGVFSENEEVPT